MIGYEITLSRIKDSSWCDNCIFWSWTDHEQRRCKTTDVYLKCMKLLYGGRKNERPLYAMFHKNNFAYVVEENKSKE